MRKRTKGGNWQRPEAVFCKAGYPLVITVYSCAYCDGCPHKTKCIKGASKTPLEERSKNLYVSKNFQRQRREMEAHINTDEGILLRTNRSIQVESVFGVLGFRRFLLRGQIKVQTKLFLLAVAYDINKLHINVLRYARCYMETNLRPLESRSSAHPTDLS